MKGTLLTLEPTCSQIEALLREIRELKLAERSLSAEKDARLKALDDTYARQLDPIQQSLRELTARVAQWAASHTEEFGDRKTLELTHGTLGWRLNPPSLKTLSGWTWKKVLAKLKALPAMSAYIRTREEVSKEAILADRAAHSPDALRAIGVKIVQEEEFWIEPRLTEVAPRELAAQAV